MGAIIKLVTGTAKTAEIEAEGAHEYFGTYQVSKCKVNTVNQEGTPFEITELELYSGTSVKLAAPTDFTSNTVFCGENGIISCDTIALVEPTSGDDIAHKIWAIIDPA